MANDFTSNPWVLDAAGATSAWTYPVKILKMVWDQPTAAGDDLSVTDGSSNVIWNHKAIAGGAGIYYTSEFYGRSWDGFYLTTLDTGTLYVYLK